MGCLIKSSYQCDNDSFHPTVGTPFFFTFILVVFLALIQTHPNLTSYNAQILNGTYQYLNATPLNTSGHLTSYADLFSTRGPRHYDCVCACESTGDEAFSWSVFVRSALARSFLATPIHAAMEIGQPCVCKV